MFSEEEFLKNTTDKNRPKILCFGDSITEQGSLVSKESQGWVALLASAYSRKIDVINRGLSGYNTRWAKTVLPKIIEEFKDMDIALIIIAFGANDATIETGSSKSQFVPVSEFKSNLKEIHDAFRSAFCNCKIIFLSTPATSRTEDRTNENMNIYTNATKDVGVELKVPVVDLWSKMQENENWKVSYLSDGLHLSSNGNYIYFSTILEHIEKNYDNFASLNIFRQYPDWKTLQSANEP